MSKDFSCRAQVDLIDKQSMCQGQHKWIMVYQDRLTNLCILRPLTSKRAPEVAYQLLDIYLLLGAPSILQSNNGSEFTAQVICILRPLTSKRAPEVAYQLLDIYLLLGAPSILQSNNGSEFTAQVICILRPLTSKRAPEVAYQLLDIYLLLGAPSILQRDNGSEYTAHVIAELKQMWPDLVIVHGKQTHPEARCSSVVRAFAHGAMGRRIDPSW